CLGEKSVPSRRKVERMSAPVATCRPPLDPSPVLESIEQRHEVGALDTENLGNLRRLAAGIVLNQSQDAVLGRSQAELRKLYKKTLEDSDLRTAQPITNNPGGWRR